MVCHGAMVPVRKTGVGRFLAVEPGAGAGALLAWCIGAWAGGFSVLRSRPREAAMWAWAATN
jgi:hypothetical protein